MLANGTLHSLCAPALTLRVGPLTCAEWSASPLHCAGWQDGATAPGRDIWGPAPAEETRQTRWRVGRRSDPL